MHFDEGIGLVAHPRDNFDHLLALDFGHVLRQVRPQVLPHVVRVVRIADGEGVVDGLFDAKSGRREVRCRGGAAEEPQ